MNDATGGGKFESFTSSTNYKSYIWLKYECLKTGGKKKEILILADDGLSSTPLGRSNALLADIWKA